MIPDFIEISPQSGGEKDFKIKLTARNASGVNKINPDCHDR
jgi:hypothetical protein